MMPSRMPASAGLPIRWRKRWCRSPPVRTPRRSTRSPRAAAQSPGLASGPNRLSLPRGSIRQCASARERWNIRVPAQPQAAANSTAAAGEASATNIATITGPRMKIISITTDSSEYAVASRSIVLELFLKKVRMQTVMGGKQAPVVAASAKAIHNGADEVSATTSARQRGGKRECAGEQHGTRAIAVDQPAKQRRHRGQAGDVAGRDQAATPEGAAGVLGQHQDRKAGDADWQAAEYGRHDGGAQRRLGQQVRSNAQARSRGAGLSPHVEVGVLLRCSNTLSCGGST